MKNKYIIGLLLLAVGLFTFNNYKATAENPKVEAATVILGYQVAYVQNSEGFYREAGMRVLYVSRSSNAPDIQVGSELAEAMAVLVDRGFEMQVPTLRSEFVFNRRKR